MKVKLFLILLIFFLLLVGCSPSEPAHDAITPLPDVSVIIEENTLQVGNMVYIPLNVACVNGSLNSSSSDRYGGCVGDSEYVNPDNAAILIMNAVYVWEQNNPDREIYDIDVHWQQSARAVYSYLYGVYIYSRPIEGGR